MESVSNNNILGGKCTKTYPIPCFRCKGIFYHICKDGDDWVSFCGNQDCLNEDSNASKSIARDEYQKRVEKNDHGQSMTGAEKFNLGSSYKHACLSKWMADRVIQNIVNSWIKDYKPFLVLMGNPGTGKTYLSASILNLLFEKKEEVFYTTHRRFIEEIHKAIEEGKTQHSVIDRLSYKKYLIFDDLGSSKCTEWQNEMVLELIDRRYSNENKTLITTNLNKKQISDILGERTASRIFDKKNETLEFWAKDQRQN
jgi:DNA replication protein DnaC